MNKFFPHQLEYCSLPVVNPLQTNISDEDRKHFIRQILIVDFTPFAFKDTRKTSRTIYVSNSPLNADIKHTFRARDNRVSLYTLTIPHCTRVPRTVVRLFRNVQRAEVEVEGADAQRELRRERRR